jgi:dTDP-4-amino-4,6-dideoxygalactose transaminase
VHLQPAYAFLGRGVGSFPEAEKLANEIITLPMYPELTDQQAQTVVGAFESYYAMAPAEWA